MNRTHNEPPAGARTRLGALVADPKTAQKHVWRARNRVLAHTAHGNLLQTHNTGNLVGCFTVIMGSALIFRANSLILESNVAIWRLITHLNRKLPGAARGVMLRSGGHDDERAHG